VDLDLAMFAACFAIYGYAIKKVTSTCLAFDEGRLLRSGDDQQGVGDSNGGIITTSKNGSIGQNRRTDNGAVK